MLLLSLPRRLILTCMIELALIAASICGFWRGMQEGKILPMFLFGSVPLMACVFIAMREAMGAEDSHSSSTGFQNSIDGLQKRLNAQDDFFQLINHNIPSTLVIYDSKDGYWFVNGAAAAELGVSENDIVGKTPVEVLGAQQGRKILKHLAQVRQDGKLLEVLDEQEKDGAPHFVQTRYRPLAATGEFSGGVMAWSENVTNLVIEKARQENMLRQVIATLVAVVDRRDPYASGHSARVGQLARAIAVEMQLSKPEIEAAEIAGSLMNFGKVLVSRAILTKTEALSFDELQRIRDSILISADILSMIDFGAPVVATLRQTLERYDGTGTPQGLAGDNILVTARIVAVANAFVALVSPRAYRDGADLIEAGNRIAEQSGKAFDPRVVAVLQNMLARGGSTLGWLSAAKPVV